MRFDKNKLYMNNTCGDGVYTRELVATIEELEAALRALPLDYFDKPEDRIDAADFVDCSNDFLTAMRLARAALGIRSVTNQ